MIKACSGSVDGGRGGLLTSLTLPEGEGKEKWKEGREGGESRQIKL